MAQAVIIPFLFYGPFQHLRGKAKWRRNDTILPSLHGIILLCRSFRTLCSGFDRPALSPARICPGEGPSRRLFARELQTELRRSCPRHKGGTLFS